MQYLSDIRVLFVSENRGLVRDTEYPISTILGYEKVHNFTHAYFHRTPGRGGSLGTPVAMFLTPRASKTPNPAAADHESEEEEETAAGAGTPLEYFSPMPSAPTTPAKVCY